MIYNLFVLTKSGITIFYKTYSPESIIENEVMVAAFFSAMFSFSNNLTGRALDLLRVGDKTFLIKECQDLLTIAFIDNDDSFLKTIEKLKKIEDYLYKNFEKHITQRTFNGNLKRFVGIEQKIDNIILEAPIPKSSNKILDKLEEIKKLVNTRKKGTKLKLNELLDELIEDTKKED